MEDNKNLDPFQAVPVINSTVTVVRLADDALRLDGVLAPVNAVERFCAAKLGFKKRVSIMLDAVGASFWNSIDGVRTLDEIERLLREKYSFETQKSRAAVMEFTKNMMLKGVILLRLSEENRDE